MFDLEEAGKCIALDRSTAAVLHLMRALEHPLKAMAKAVDVPLKENWNSILNDIENKVRGKNKDGDRNNFWDNKKRSNLSLLEPQVTYSTLRTLGETTQRTA